MPKNVFFNENDVGDKDFLEKINLLYFLITNPEIISPLIKHLFEVQTIENLTRV